jgi:hypothetical protein
LGEELGCFLRKYEAARRVYGRKPGRKRKVRTEFKSNISWTQSHLDEIVNTIILLTKVPKMSILQFEPCKFDG